MVPTADGDDLAVTRWSGAGSHVPHVVFLHAGVADRRSWHGVARALADDGLDLLAHDRRGSGDSPPAADPAAVRHVDDLVAVLDALDVERALLVGNSRGGAVALDTALLHPHRVSGLVLLGAAVSGMTDDDTPFDWQLDAASAPLVERSEDEDAPVAERVAALAHLWLDGPEAPEGRVGDPARALFTAMATRLLELGDTDGAARSVVDAWTRLDEVAAPTLCAWGDLDLPCDLPFYEETARRLGQGPGRVLPAVAHLPGLERPELVADLVREVLGRRSVRP